MQNPILLGLSAAVLRLTKQPAYNIGPYKNGAE
jgi:hypothetical protein